MYTVDLLIFLCMCCLCCFICKPTPKAWFTIHNTRKSLTWNAASSLFQRELHAAMPPRYVYCKPIPNATFFVHPASPPIVCLQVYIQYMKFSRRTSGISVARQVFKRAREDERIGHQVRAIICR